MTSELKSFMTYEELLLMDNETKRDLFAKFSLIADSYVGATSKELLQNNKDSLEVLLSGNILNYMLYLNESGELADLIASNSRVQELFNKQSGYYIVKLRKDLKEKGWGIRKESSLGEVKQSLEIWGIEETDDIGENADIISDNDEHSEILDRLLKQQEEESQAEKEAAERAEAERIAAEQAEAERIAAEKAAAEREAAERAAQELDRAAREKEMQEELEKYAEASLSASDVDVPDELTGEAQTTKLSEDIMQRDAEIASKIAAVKELEEQKRKKAEQEELEKAISEEAANNDNVDKAVVTRTVNSIMNIYDVMYQPLFEISPKGVLTSVGIVNVTKDNKLHVISTDDGNTYAQSLCAAIYKNYQGEIRELDYHEEVSINCIDENTGALKYNYVPNFHIHNIFGVYKGQDGTLKRDRSWKSFRSKLTKSLSSYITSIFKDFKGDAAGRIKLSANLIELFTTVMVMEEFDINKSVKMTINSIAITNNHRDGCSGIGDIIKEGTALGLPSNSITLVDNSQISQGVHSILAVLDEAIYNGEMLFAYKPIKKIIESGGSVNLANTLLGRDMKGRNLTYNFESPQAIVTLVIAGSGSGKGVLTLNMLATFIAEGCPTIYVDYKPDMSAMLWDLERSVPGSRILATESLSSQSKEGIKPVRDYNLGYGVPTGIPSDLRSKMNVLSYMKMIQLMIISASARKTGYNGMTSNKKMMFILDEAQAMNKSLGSLKDEIEAYLKAHRVTKDNPITPEIEYLKKVRSFINNMYSGVTSFRNTDARVGYVGAIILGQQSDCSAWSSGGAMKRDTLGFLVGNCSAKLLGKDACDGTKYSLGGCEPAGNNFLGKMGYFALVPKALADKSSKDSVKVVKTYLVLNQNDYQDDGMGGSSGHCTGGMLKNVTDPRIRDQLINEDFTTLDQSGNRVINPLVGFPGLIQYIGQNIDGFDLVTNLSAGYNEIDKLLSGLGITGEGGKYSCIEEYVYDYSPSGIFSTSDLLEFINNGGTIADLEEVIDVGGGAEDSGESGGFSDRLDRGGFSVTDTDDEPTSDKETPAPNTIDELLRNGQQSGAHPINNNSQGVGGAQPTGAVAEILRNAQQQPQSGRPNFIEKVFGMDEVPEPPVQVQPQPQTAQLQPQEAAPIDDSDSFGDFDDIPEDVEEPNPQPIRLDRNGNPASGDIDEEALNNTGESNSGFNINDERATPDQKRYSEHSTFSDGLGRCIYATPERTTRVLGLTAENSVLAQLPPYTTAEKFSKKLFQTLWGTEYEFKHRWQAILNAVASSQNPNTVRRLTILEDAVVFNKKHVATLGIIGGDEDIRIEDIVNFKMTAKKYKEIGEIILDDTIFGVAQIELGDAIQGLFNIFPKLQKLAVLSVGCGSVTLQTNRQEVQNSMVNADMQRAQNRAAFKNQMETIAAARNPNLRTRSPGYQSRIWNTTKNLSGNQWQAAKGALMEKNPRLFKATMLTGASLLILGVGGIGAAIGRVGSLFRR